MTDDNQCPLCRKTVGQLQFHHWDYDKDTGVELCPGCHYWIHGGDRATDQEKETKQYAATTNWEEATLGWRHNAVNRVVIGDLSSIQSDHPALDSINEYVEFLVDRYEIPGHSLLPEWLLERLVEGEDVEAYGDSLSVDFKEYKQIAEDEGWST